MSEALRVVDPTAERVGPIVRDIATSDVNALILGETGDIHVELGAVHGRVSRGSGNRPRPILVGRNDEAHAPADDAQRRASLVSARDAYNAALAHESRGAIANL